MKKLTSFVVLSVLVLLAGCTDEQAQNTNTGKLTDSQQIVAQVAQPANWELQKQQYEAKIAKLSQENIDIQNKAMECIMKMITKQIERDTMIQDKLKTKITKLEGENNTLFQKVQKLEAKLAMKQSKTGVEVANVIE